MLNGEYFAEMGLDGLRFIVFLDGYLAPWRTSELLEEFLESGSYIQQLQRKGFSMTKKKERPQVIFVNVRVERAQKDAVGKWAGRKGFDYLTELEHLVQAGYKVGVSWDNRNQCFIVSVTCWEDGAANYAHCFSTRHGSIQKAIELMLYKVNVLLEESPWGEVSQADDWG
jgi:hypothetical protein